MYCKIFPNDHFVSSPTLSSIASPCSFVRAMSLLISSSGVKQKAKVLAMKSKNDNEKKRDFLTIRKMFFLLLLNLSDDSFQFLRYLLVVRVCRFHTYDSWKVKSTNSSVQLLHPYNKSWEMSYITQLTINSHDLSVFFSTSV